MDIKFLCLNGTVFDQETRVCERVDEVDCSKSERFYNLNLELYGNNAVTLRWVQLSQGSFISIPSIRFEFRKGRNESLNIYIFHNFIYHPKASFPKIKLTIESATFPFSWTGIRSENSYCRDSVHLSRAKCLLTTVWTFTSTFDFVRTKGALTRIPVDFTYAAGSWQKRRGNRSSLVIFDQSFRICLLPFRMHFECLSRDS